MDKNCKKCRAVGEKLFLKGEKCYSPKCPMARKGIAYRGKSKRKSSLSSYGKQLLEKQKAKLTYGIRERQFHRYFDLAKRKKGATPDILATILESRMDNIVFRSGLAPNRATARKLISHGHFLLNGKRHNIASAIIKKEDILLVNPTSANIKIFKDAKEYLKKYTPPKFIQLNPDKLAITIAAEPDLGELKMIIDFPSIVEFYSK